jgi:predicted DNA-binding antitoxin AbrB/MazE fold protein
MSLEVEATYENGILKLDQPLPLQEQERVVVSIRPKTSRVRHSHGLIPWTGSPEDLEYLLGPDNHPWEER